MDFNYDILIPYEDSKISIKLKQLILSLKFNKLIDIKLLRFLNMFGIKV